MVKPELGTKRVCQSCAARFYDLGRDPALCPKCGFENSLEALTRVKRSRTPPVETKAKPSVRRAVKEDTDDDLAIDVEEGEEEEEIIEDASELGEDDEDVSDVLENADDDSDADER